MSTGVNLVLVASDDSLGEQLTPDLPDTWIAELANMSGEAATVQQHGSLNDYAQFLASASAGDERDVAQPGGTVGVLLLSQSESQAPDAEQMIGRAIRLFPHRLLIAVPAGTLAEPVFFALGFRRIAGPDLQSFHHAFSWYEYSLRHYKPAPDWLNSRHWANPERFHVVEDPDQYCEDDDDHYESAS